MNLITCRLCIFSVIVLPCAGFVLRKRNIESSTTEFGRAVEVQKNKVVSHDEWPRELLFETQFSFSLSFSFSYHQGAPASPANGSIHRSPVSAAVANRTKQQKSHPPTTTTIATNLTCDQLPSTAFDAVLDIATAKTLVSLSAAENAFQSFLEHLIQPCSNSTWRAGVEPSLIMDGDLFLGNVQLTPLAQNCTTSLPDAKCQIVNLNLTLYGNIKQAILTNIPVTLMELYRQAKWNQWLASQGILSVQLAAITATEATASRSRLTSEAPITSK